MNRLTDRYDTYDDDEYGTDEEAETPTDHPQPYPKDLPVKLLRIKEWMEDSGRYSFTAYARKCLDDIVRYDIPGHVVEGSDQYELIWEKGLTQATEARPLPSPGIQESSMVLSIHDAAQAVLGLDDAEAELLFYGEDLAGNENEDLSRDFLNYLILCTANAFGGVHLTPEEVQEYRSKWSMDRGIHDPEGVWQEGQVSPRAFIAA
jgi:hypothetical protein